MKILLVAVNAKYIHSNPAIYSMRAYAKQYLENNVPSISNECEIDLKEFTINQLSQDIMKEIYLCRPDWIGFSCYIWNISMIHELVTELHKIMPSVPIWLGGPEVSFHEKEVMDSLPAVTGIMSGEGEVTFTELIQYYVNRQMKSESYNEEEMLNIPGIWVRSGDEIKSSASRCPMDMSLLPFPYKDIKDFENRIVYYETSRGCPFSCAYCLSSVDKKLRYRDMDLVRRELQFFIDAKVPQVKFIDRTFNCDHRHSMEILRFIQEKDNGITNFHFEIAADILTEEEIEMLRSLRPGLVQLEIGVQSTNEKTLEIVNRRTNLEKVRENSGRLLESRNIHLHLDLIAGLPGENIESFIKSFNDVYSMGSDELQLGFLKLLKGSPMERLAPEYGIVCMDQPPYEVLYTKDLTYSDVLHLKAVEEMLEIYHNSQQFVYTEKCIFPDILETSVDMGITSGLSFVKEQDMKPFDLYKRLADYYEENKENIMNSSRVRRYEMFLTYIMKEEGIENPNQILKKWKNVNKTGNRQEAQLVGNDLKQDNKDIPSDAEAVWQEINGMREMLVIDYYQRENAKARPDFALSQAKYKDIIYDFYKNEEKERRYLQGYEGYDWKQLMRMTHLEILEYRKNQQANAYLFDYSKRSLVTGGARMIPLWLCEIE